MHWRSGRRELGVSMLRQFYKRYAMDDMDPNGIFRTRVTEKMKLRKKTRGECESFLKFRQLLVSSTKSLEQSYLV